MRNPYPYISLFWAILFILIYGMLELLNLFFYTILEDGTIVKLFPPGAFLIITGLATLLTVGSRLYCMHPFYDADYFNWLRLTPWQVGLPLPYGSIVFDWKDAVVVCVFRVLSARGYWFLCFMPPLVFVLFYVGVSFGAYSSLAPRYAYFLNWSFGAIILAAALWPTACVILLLALYPVTAHFNLRIMRRFPWLHEDGTPKVRVKVDPVSARRSGDVDITKMFSRLNPEKSRLRKLEAGGWPQSRFLVLPPNPQINLVDGLIVSGLIGWWCFVMISFLDRYIHAGEIAFIAVIYFGVIISLAGSRIVQYMEGAYPTLGPIARLLIFRLIQPKYDIIFLPSLIVLLLSPIAYKVIVYQFSLYEKSQILLEAHTLNDWLMAAIFGLTISLFSMIINSPPTLYRWRLTGHYRSPMPLTSRSELIDT